MSLSAKQLVYTISLVVLILGILGVEGVPPSDLHRRWAINYPSVTYVNSGDSINSIIVDYGRSADLSTENTRTKLYTHDCEGPELTDGILSNTIDATTGAHVFQMDMLTLLWDEEVTTMDPSFQNATMRFCLRYSLWSGDDANSIEINSVYNILSIHLDTACGIEVAGFLIDEFFEEEPEDDDLPMGDRHDHHEKEKHRLDVYLCDQFTHERVDPPVGGYGMGDVLSICAEASQSLIDDAMYLRGVDNFVWRRTVFRNGQAHVTEQWAVKDGVPDGVSTYHCPMYSLFCTFTTMLNAEFFMKEGFVQGIGSASIQFGSRKLDVGGKLNVEVPCLDKKQIIHTNESETILMHTNESEAILMHTNESETILMHANETEAIPSRSLQQQKKRYDPDVDKSNMAIWIWIRGPGHRPSLASDHPPPLVAHTNTKRASSWMIWLIVICFLIVFGMSAYLYRREFYRGKGGKLATRNSIS